MPEDYSISSLSLQSRAEHSSYRRFSGLGTTHEHALCGESARSASSPDATRSYSPDHTKTPWRIVRGHSSGFIRASHVTSTVFGSLAAVLPSYMVAIQTIHRQQRMSLTEHTRTSPNHALQRTAPAVTLAASAAALPPTVQPARQPPPSLSLRSLGVATVSPCPEFSTSQARFLPHALQCIIGITRV